MLTVTGFSHFSVVTLFQCRCLNTRLRWFFSKVVTERLEALTKEDFEAIKGKLNKKMINWTNIHYHLGLQKISTLKEVILMVCLASYDLWKPVKQESYYATAAETVRAFDAFLKAYQAYRRQEDLYIANASSLNFEEVQSLQKNIDTRIDAQKEKWTANLRLTSGNWSLIEKPDIEKIAKPYLYKRAPETFLYAIWRRERGRYALEDIYWAAEQNFVPAKHEYRVSPLPQNPKIMAEMIFREYCYNFTLNRGYFRAQISKGDSYKEKKEFAKALLWYRRAAEQNSPYAQRMVGFLLSQQGDEAQGLEWSKKAALQGDLIALYDYGVSLAKATDSKAQAEGFRCVKSAIDQGLEKGEAYERLGFLYFHGVGVQKDRDKGLLWLQKAAEKGYDVAELELGLFYLELEGNREEAIKWLLNPAAKGNLESQFVLGMAYSRDNKFEQAVAWLKEAAQHGHVQAPLELVKIFRKLGTASDNQQAVDWLKKAIARKNIPAMNMLGTIYADGIPGVSRDLFAAVKYYTQAAELFDGNGEYNMGLMTLTGRGVRKDEATALKWFKRAFEHGFQDAQKYIQSLRRSFK